MQEISTAALLSLGLNALLGLVTLLGVAWMRRMENDMTELRKQFGESAREMQDRLDMKAGKEDFTEFRREFRENFREVFNRMDGLRDQIATKADRP